MIIRNQLYASQYNDVVWICIYYLNSMNLHVFISYPFGTSSSRDARWCNGNERFFFKLLYMYVMWVFRTWQICGDQKTTLQCLLLVHLIWWSRSVFHPCTPQTFLMEPSHWCSNKIVRSIVVVNYCLFFSACKLNFIQG